MIGFINLAFKFTFYWKFCYHRSKKCV